MPPFIRSERVDAPRCEHRPEVAGALGDPVARCASDAVVNVTPFAQNRSSSPSAGYCSWTGFIQPLLETSAERPFATAASAMRSHHSSGASGILPATLIRSGCASTSQVPVPASSSMHRV